MDASDQEFSTLRPPDLKSCRMLLRSPQIADTGPMTLYAGDPRVARMTTSIPHPYHPGMAESFVEQVLSGTFREDVWAMDATPSDGPPFLGLIGYAAKAGEIDYWVGPPFWSTGYATEAVVRLCRYLEDDLAKTEIRAAVFADNQGSQRVLDKAGFERDGTCDLHSVARGQKVPAIRFMRRVSTTFAEGQS